MAKEERGKKRGIRRLWLGRKTTVLVCTGRTSEPDRKPPENEVNFHMGMLIWINLGKSFLDFVFHSPGFLWCSNTCLWGALWQFISSIRPISLIWLRTSYLSKEEVTEVLPTKQPHVIYPKVRAQSTLSSKCIFISESFPSFPQHFLVLCLTVPI